MNFEEKILDRQVGRNADLFARAIGEMKTPDERYPYIRILTSIIEQAHPEWAQAPTKDQQISHLIFHMSKGTVKQDEVAEIVRLRDEERGFTYIERKTEKDAKPVTPAPDAKANPEETGDSVEASETTTDAATDETAGKKEEEAEAVDETAGKKEEGAEPVDEPAGKSEKAAEPVDEAAGEVSPEPQDTDKDADQSKSESA